MKNHSNDPLGVQNKGNHQLTELKTIFLYLQDHVCTASMLAEQTGIKQKNICRYKRDLEQSGRLWEIKKDICQLTGFKAWYLTTNPDLRPLNQNQLSLFTENDPKVLNTVCRVKDLVNKRFSKEVIKLASDINARKINKRG